MTTINATPSSAHVLSPTSLPASPIPAPLIEDTVETLPNLSLEELEEKKVKRLVLFLALNGLSGEKRLEKEEHLLKEYSLSKADLPLKHLQMPPEIIDEFFYRTLLNLEPDEIVRVTQANGELVRENWLALYQNFDWLYPETVSTLFEFQTLVEDARIYGQKTFEQIFSGFYLLKRIKENPNALAEMTIEDLQQAGIYTDIWKYPIDDSTREIAPQNFLRWIQANPACILMCLRWVPARNFAPDLLVEATNHSNLAIVKTVFAFIKEHHITDFDAERALRDAIIKGHIPIADYLVSKEVQARVRWLPEDILHQAVIINPSFKNIEWLVKNGVPLNHIGSDRLNSQEYGKTAADIAISRLALYCFTDPLPESRKKEMDELYIALYLIDQGAPFNLQYQPEEMTLLHAVCYAEDVELGLRVARLVIEQDPSCIHTPTQDENAFTPLHLAFKERKYRLMELLLEHGADATIPIQEDMTSNERAKKRSVIEIAYQSNNIDAQKILQKTGNTNGPCQYNFDWVYPKWVSTEEEFRELIGDACKYGQRTGEQIFEGLNILRLINLPGPQAPITFQHLERAGIVQKGPLYPNDIEASEQAQNTFVDWIRAHPGHLLAFLRWVPIQCDIPYLCKQDIMSPLYAEKALKQAVKNADLPIAHYLLDKASIRRMPINSLHIAAGTGSLEMVKLLINHNVLLGKKGIGQDNQDSYRDKTAAEVAVSAIAASYFSPNAPQAIRKHGVNLLSTVYYLLKEGQKQDISFDPTYSPTGMTLLHAACYASSKEEGLWLAQWAFSQNPDPTCIHEVDSEGRTPLYRAIQQKRPLLVDFLLNNGAKINLTHSSYVALQRNDPEIFSLLENKKKVGSIHITYSSILPTLNLILMLNRIWTLLTAIPWPQWSSLWRPYALYLAFFQESATPDCPDGARKLYTYK